MSRAPAPAVRRLLRLSALLLAAGIAPVAFAVACGPSQQSIYEGTVRFEHCYRLDLDLEIAAGHRAACWNAWLDSYTYGQPRDRIEYARRRVRAFALGDTSRPVLDMRPERREARQFYLVVPSPTSVYAPPAPIATRWYAPSNAPDAGADAGDAASSALTPADNCARDCRTTMRDCQSACDVDAAPAGKACKACEADYKKCMRRCFE